MKRKFSHLHFHDLNIQWISCWYWLTGLFFLRRPLANRNCLLTDAFHRTWMMSWSLFHWFQTALLNCTYPCISSFCLPYSQPCTSNIAAELMPSFCHAPSCSNWTLLFEPRGQRAWRRKKTFSSIQDTPMMSQIYEDVVLQAVLTLAWWQTAPGIHRNGLQDGSTDPRYISHYPRGEEDGCVRTLILITSASFPHLFCSRPEVWVLKAWDLQWSSTVCF